MKKEEKLKLIERVWCNGVIKNKVYNSFGNHWYDGDKCPECSVELSHDNADYSAGYNGKTSGHAGQRKRVKYCRDDYLKRQREREIRLKKSRLLNTEPAQKVLAFMGYTKHNAQKLTERNLLAEKLYGRKEWNIMMKARESNIAPFVYPQEHEKRLKSAGRSVESAIKARNANKDDGFTYTLTHPLWPEIKIGYTYNPPSRLSQFNTCCPHRLFSMPYISTYLKDAKLAEEAIHETLKEYRADGEWFNVSLEIATKTIEDYVRSLDDNPQEQALG